MQAYTRWMKTAALGLALGLLAPVVFVAVFVRRASWHRIGAAASAGRERVAGELDNWRYEYTFHELWTGEKKRLGRR